ncbi:MAG: hypothetical protein DRP02_02365 [Candidatus Gerdarchaeota archaeon]|nr:MAG: hypothetical protein DRP02_02365 [Candidatus Gerdarchaeota archaeon]
MVLEPTGSGSQTTDLEVVSHIRERYQQKNDEFDRRRLVREWLSKYMQKLLGSETDSEIFSPSQVFTSNLMRRGYEYVDTAKLFPDSIDFDPIQPDSPLKEHDIADNYASLVQYSNVVGGRDKMVRDSKRDLAFGECWITQEYQKKGSRVIKIKQKAIKWENVRGFYGETDLITIENLTVGAFVEEYGEEMLKKVQYGFPIQVNDDYEETSIDEKVILIDKSKRIGVVKFWDYALKRHNVLLGGGAYMPPEMQQDGDDYFWVDDDGDGYCPVRRRVYKEASRGYHGYGVIDLLYPLAYLETVIVNASSHAAVLASDPLLIFYADDIEEMKNKWEQYLATKTVGSQSPFHVKQDRTNPIKLEQLAFDPKINIFEVWREFVINEGTMRTGIDFKILIDYAPTDGQQKSRKYETDKTNRFVLAANAVVDRDFAMDTIYMLKNGDSEFHDKTLYVKVGDYFYSKMTEGEQQKMKDKNGQYFPVPTPIREFLKENKDTEFSITARLDGILDDQTFFEMQDARNDIGLLPQGSEASTKLSEFYFGKKYGSVKFNREDFGIPQPEGELPPV